MTISHDRYGSANSNDEGQDGTLHDYYDIWCWARRMVK